MRAFRQARYFIAISLMIASGPPVFASSCNRIVVQQIQFAKGATCWYYAGKATHFRGNFSKGQQVTIEMSGEVWEQPVGQPENTMKPGWTVRLPNITGPHDFYAELPPALDEAPSVKLETAIPETEKYTISFNPCAMTNGYGHVSICASAPSR
jgi:hypothetical protein